MLSGKSRGKFISCFNQVTKDYLKLRKKRFEMKQPELGKKISELRKAKGLTQEELVEKCNLNVRTIQRI